MTKSIYVAGHRGLVGSALTRAIDARDEFTWFGRTREELDLLDRQKVFSFLTSARPDIVVVAAAKVGGIVANSAMPVEFMSENLLIQTNLLDACHAANVSRLVFLGSSCIYPKFAPQPIPESSLLTGSLEPTNSAYALAKIAGLRLTQAYTSEYGRDWISLMPTNVYGPGDNFDTETAHVLPALLAKFHQAKVSQASEVVLWGSGEPLREFIHSDDLASAILHCVQHYSSSEPLNIGSGNEVSIRTLAEMVAEVTEYRGKVRFDASKPDGTPRKLLDSNNLSATGWSPTIGLQEGLTSTYGWYKAKVSATALAES